MLEPHMTTFKRNVKLGPAYKVNDVVLYNEALCRITEYTPCSAQTSYPECRLEALEPFTNLGKNYRRGELLAPTNPDNLVRTSVRPPNVPYRDSIHWLIGQYGFVFSPLNGTTGFEGELFEKTGTLCRVCWLATDGVSVHGVHDFYPYSGRGYKEHFREIASLQLALESLNLQPVVDPGKVPTIEEILQEKIRQYDIKMLGRLLRVEQQELGKQPTLRTCLKYLAQWDLPVP